MIPLPTSRIFRSRRGALWWSFWVIVGAVTSVPFLPAGNGKAQNAAIDSTGEDVNQADLQAIASAFNAN